MVEAVVLALSVQWGWPQPHIISVFPAMPSQCALQYFDLSVGMQIQAGFAHFLSAIRSPLMAIVRAEQGTDVRCRLRGKG